jgi:SPP1 family predicted phage head-tail adaptor
MSVIKPGELNDRLTVLKKIGDGETYVNGFPVLETEALFSLRCKRKTISTKEFVESDRAQSELQYKFIVRKRNIDNDMLIQYQGKTFDVKHVHEIDKHYLELTVNETANEV